MLLTIPLADPQEVLETNRDQNFIGSKNEG